MIELTADTFEKEVMLREGEALLVFYADWAEPSVALLNDLRKMNRPPVLTVKVDEMPVQTHMMGVEALPTLFYMVDGEVVRRKIGYDPDETISGVMQEDEE